jgi:translation initiation factor 3 subunit F
MIATPPAPAILSLPHLQKSSSQVGHSAPAQPASLKANVSVVALLSILDHWIHRDPGSLRVVGALLGTRSEDGGLLQITDTFPIVLLDNDSSIDVDFAASMYQLRRRASPKDLVLGWYSSGCTLDEASPALHDWFESNLISTSGSFHHGVHLLVNTELEDNTTMQGYIGYVDSNPVDWWSKGPRCWRA